VTLGLLLAIVIGGLVIGALARLALPGPDPMPIWMTILLGIAGAILGAVIAALFGIDEFTYSLPLSVGGASLLLYLHRRFVQRRPLTGPRARGRV